jgi:hypothetical protein
MDVFTGQYVQLKGHPLEEIIPISSVTYLQSGNFSNHENGNLSKFFSNHLGSA